MGLYAAQFGVAAAPAWLVLGPAAPGRRWRAPLLGLAGWLAGLPLATVAMLANQWLLFALGRGAPLQPVLERYVESHGWDRAVGLFAVVALAPLFEEVVFRGAIYRGLRGLAGVWPAALGSGLVFAAIHGAAPQALPILVLGVLLALCYERAGTLLAPITLHALHNGAALAWITAA
jgi:membrane protease YdiL (CAAX protease family)